MEKGCYMQMTRPYAAFHVDMPKEEAMLTSTT